MFETPEDRMIRQGREIQDEIERLRTHFHCENNLITDEGGEKICGPGCAGCICYNADLECCDIRQEAVFNLNEAAYDREHDYLDPHPRSEDD